MEKDKPVYWFVADKNQIHCGAIHFDDGKALLTAQFVFPSTDKAKEFELKSLSAIRTAANQLADELDIPIVKDVKDAKVDRNGMRVTVTGFTHTETAKASIEAFLEHERRKSN